MSANRNFYTILGVSRTASQPAIKTAFRIAAKKAHSDLGGSDAQMADINEAYETLGDPGKREAYDNLQRAKSTARSTQKAHASTGATGYAADYDTPDPNSEEGDWGSATGAATNHQTHTATPPPPPASPPPRPYTAKDAAYSIIKFILHKPLWALAFLGIGTWVYAANHHSPSPPAISNSGPSVVQGAPTPSSVVAGSATGDTSTPAPLPASTPEPTATPAVTPPPCPVGAPSIVLTSVSSKPDTSSGPWNSQDDPTFTMRGTATNPTSATVQIGSIGFYLGSNPSSSAPNGEISFSGANDHNTSQIPPHSSTTWYVVTPLHWHTETLGPVPAQVTPRIEYSRSGTGPVRAQWSFSDTGISDTCQPPGYM